MEQKKTLWIIAAVGVFLLVIMGGVGIFYAPAKNLKPNVEQVATAPQTQNSGWTTQENVNNTPVSNVTTTPTTQKVGEMIVVSDNTTVYGVNQTPAPAAPATTPSETTIDLNKLKNELQTTPSQPQNINITVNVPEKEANVGVAQNTTTTVQNVIPLAEPTVENKVVLEDKKEENKVSKVEKKETKKAESKSVVAPSVTKKEDKSSTKNTKITEKKASKPISQYWVQVGSYSNKKAAENARAILDANKISSDIFTYEDNKDTLYFRVRVGPYMTASEAEYWKARILKIPYFTATDSYITKTTK